MKKIFKAIDFAQKAHNGQCRKGCELPYIVHPLGVMEILIRAGQSEDVIVAGILHDTLEDTDVTEEQIEKKFGKRVKDLVIAASEPDHDAPWEVRKQHTIEFLSQCSDEEVLMISCADKLHNIISFIDDYEIIGEDLWSRFKRGKETQKWYYTALADIFIKYDKKNPLFKEFHKIVYKLFK